MSETMGQDVTTDEATQNEQCLEGIEDSWNRMYFKGDIGNRPETGAEWNWSYF